MSGARVGHALEAAGHQPAEDPQQRPLPARRAQRRLGQQQ
jgi:hypothetical protein